MKVGDAFTWVELHSMGYLHIKSNPVEDTFLGKDCWVITKHLEHHYLITRITPFDH